MASEIPIRLKNETKEDYRKKLIDSVNRNPLVKFGVLKKFKL